MLKKLMKERTAAIFLILILIGGLLSCRKGNFERKVNVEEAGGPCRYENVPITILIKKIEKEKLSGESEILIISYEMTFEGGIKKGKVEYGLVEVKPEEAEAKAVEIGKSFHASVSRLVSGTCDPEPRYPDLKDWK